MFVYCFNSVVALVSLFTFTWVVVVGALLCVVGFPFACGLILVFWCWCCFLLCVGLVGCSLQVGCVCCGWRCVGVGCRYCWLLVCLHLRLLLV